MILRLEPPIEVETPLGRGWAIIFRDYGFDHDDLWTVLISKTMQFWTFRNRDIRGVKNYTFGVGPDKPNARVAPCSECDRVVSGTCARLGCKMPQQV